MAWQQVNDRYIAMENPDTFKLFIQILSGIMSLCAFFWFFQRSERAYVDKKFTDLTKEREESRTRIHERVDELKQAHEDERVNVVEKFAQKSEIESLSKNIESAKDDLHKRIDLVKDEIAGAERRLTTLIQGSINPSQHYPFTQKKD